MNSSSSQPAGPSRDNASPQAQSSQGPVPQFLPFHPGQEAFQLGQVPFQVGQAPPSYGAPANMPPPGQAAPNILPGYGYPQTFHHHPTRMVPFSPYTGSGVPQGTLSHPTMPSIASPMQSPMQPIPIPVPGNPGLFYIPQTYKQPQPLSHSPNVSPPVSEWLKASAPLPEGSPAEPEVAPATMQEEPFWCFQCQQWHKSKEAQDQAHAVLHPQVSPRPETAQPNTQGGFGTNEGDLAARMSQAIKEAVAAEFASRNMPPRGAYQEAVAEPQYSNPDYSPRTPAADPRSYGLEWGNDYRERPRVYGERPRDYRERLRDYEGHYRYGLDYKEADSQQQRYRAPYDEQSRSTTPADARAWRDANSGLDPDEIRAETDSMVSAGFSEMTIQDFKRDSQGNNGNTKYKSYAAEEYSSESNGSEGDTSLPLKYLPSPYPNISTWKKGNHSQSNSKKDRRQSKRSELDRQQARATESEEAQLQQIAPRRRLRESFQDDDETPKQRPRSEKPHRGTQQEQPKVEKAMEESQITTSKSSNSPTKTAPPSVVKAQAAILAYAQWYTQTYGLDPSFITNLQASMASTFSAVSVKPHDRHQATSKETSKRVPSPQPSETSTEARYVANTEDLQAPLEDGTSVHDGYSVSEHSWKSENTVKRRGSKNSSNRESATGSLRGGRTGYSSPDSLEYLEPLRRYLQQARVKDSRKPHLAAVPPKSKTTQSDTADMRGEKKKARMVTQLATPTVTVLTPAKPEVEPSHLVIERSRRQYSLVFDKALKPVTAEDSIGIPIKKGKGCSNRGNETSPSAERHCPIPEYAKPEESYQHAKGIEVKTHPAVERTHPLCEPPRPNDPIPTAQNIRSGSHGWGLAHGSKSSTPGQSRHHLRKPTVEAVPDDYDTRGGESWAWDTKLGGYVNINPKIANPYVEKFTADSRELEHDYSQSGLRARQTPCSTERGHGGDAESSVFDFQVEEFSDGECPCSDREQDPGNEEYNEDDWEDEGPGEEDASETDSEESYTDEVLLELLSDGRYSDVISGIFSDVDTEVTMFPGADGDRVVGAPRDMRTQSSYETGTSAGSRSEQGETKGGSREKCGREGGERQMEGGKSYGRVYSRRDDGSSRRRGWADAMERQN
ncbi:hypothetical protein EV426DRAFT_672300 [Tirmania nivea]|nr:hypothetical protein EV426DRAFT_672300 [Tirmania nivea]